MGKGRFNFAPIGEGLSAEEYFQQYADQRKAHFGADFVVLEEGEEAPPEERAVTILEPARRITDTELGTSPKKVYLAAKALGWQLAAWVSVSDVAPVLYLNDSVEGAENPHSAGDIRYEGYLARNYTVEARHPKLRLGFRARWVGKGIAGMTASFSEAKVADPVGIPTELYMSYEMNKIQADVAGLTERAAATLAAERRGRYDDGATYLAHTKMMLAGREFTLWIDDWIRMLGVEHKALTPVAKPKKTETETASAMLAGEEWVG